MMTHPTNTSTRRATVTHASAAIPALLAFAMLSMLPGCQNPSATLVHAGVDPLPDLAPAREAELSRHDGVSTLDGTPAPAMPAPSATSLDRTAWSTVTVNQPRGQVEVQPTYYRLYQGNPDDPRANGSYPTTATALRTGGGRPTALQDMAAAPVVGIFWMVIAPGHVIVVPPWTVRRQPDGGFEVLPPTEGAP
jgi:hypothetical protein